MSVFARTWLMEQSRHDACNRWREATGIYLALSTPQLMFDIIKQCYPHFAHGLSKNGEVVFYECVGRMQFERLVAARVSPFDIQVRHCSFLGLTAAIVATHHSGNGKKPSGCSCPSKILRAFECLCP